MEDEETEITPPLRPYTWDELEDEHPLPAHASEENEGEQQ